MHHVLLVFRLHSHDNVGNIWTVYVTVAVSHTCVSQDIVSTKCTIKCTQFKANNLLLNQQNGITVVWFDWFSIKRNLHPIIFHFTKK